MALEEKKNKWRKVHKVSDKKYDRLMHGEGEYKKDLLSASSEFPTAI